METRRALDGRCHDRSGGCVPLDRARLPWDPSVFAGGNLPVYGTAILVRARRGDALPLLFGRRTDRDRVYPFASLSYRGGRRGGIDVNLILWLFGYGEVRIPVACSACVLDLAYRARLPFSNFGVG